MAFETLLFSRTLRLYFARTVIISSLISSVSLALLDPDLFSFAASPESGINTKDAVLVITVFAVMTGSFVFIAIHHMASLLRPMKFFYGLLDFILLMIEIIGVFLYAIIVVPGTGSSVSEIITYHLVFVCMTLVGLCSLAVFRLATIIRSRGRAFILPFNILSDQQFSDQNSTFFSRFMGRTFWKPRFIGETKVITLTRGFLSLAFLAAMVFWIMTKTVIEPMKETALGPIREFHSMTPPEDFLENMDLPVWNILIPRSINSTTSTPQEPPSVLQEIIQVQALWYDRDGPPCMFVPNPRDQPYSDRFLYQFICPGADSSTASYQLPDLLINVNFSLIDYGARQAGIYPRASLNVVLGMTNTMGSIKRVMEITTPTVIFPGSNMVATVISDIRQVFVNGGLAALGLFQPTTTFWNTHIVTMQPDPWFDYQDTSRSTLRIFMQENDAATKIVQDYRQNSVIAGFADIGGLWTTLSGIFALIFGASILHFVYGAKPLSIFGIVHSFQRQHMKEETLRLYPNILEEHKSQDSRGLLALLRDQLIDLSFLEKEHPEDQTIKVDVEQPQTEKGNDLERSRLATRASRKSGDGVGHEPVSLPA